jgi:hypothetical protein
MLIQIGQAIKFAAFFSASKAGKTGLTVTVDVYRDGTSLVTGASATEIGGGLYSYTLVSGSVTTAGNHIAIFKTSDTTVDAQHVPSFFSVGQNWVERVDAAISSRSTFAGGAVASVTGSVGSVTAAVTVGTNNDKSGYELSTAGLKAMWDQLLSVTFTVGSLGEKLKLWLATLGTDNRVQVSADIHTAGATVASVTAPVTVGTNNDKVGYGLTSGERTAVANEVENQIIDDTDTEKVLTAITNKIAAANPDLSGLTLSAIASAVWMHVERTLTDLTETEEDGFATIDALGATINAIKAKTDGLPALPPSQADITAARDTVINSINSSKNTVIAALPPAPPSAASILATFKADPEWETILASANGQFTFNPLSGVLVLKNKAGTQTLATLTLTRNEDGVVTSRASS